jgi:K+-transporting ATPase KdpF subunit
MSFDYKAGLILACLLGIYLVYALVRPEKF